MSGGGRSSTPRAQRASSPTMRWDGLRRLRRAQWQSCPRQGTSSDWTSNCQGPSGRFSPTNTRTSPARSIG
eukprot:6967167-Alexandrium_andersonii.AAC.1